MIINGYTLKEDLQNANSGFSKWGFAVKNGKEYFIKELIKPVYPIDASSMPEDLYRHRVDYCNKYENKFRRYFGQINRVSRGNLVRVEEFFRCKSKYYLITEKIDGNSIRIEYIASTALDKKMLLLKTVAHCFNDLHSAGIVHFDVKPANIIVKMTKTGNYTAKVIDFDSGFFNGEVLEESELGGDLTYLAPETFLGMYGEDVHPDEKADIFALGLVFHEYLCGRLPYFNAEEYEYPYEAVLDGGELKTYLSDVPEELRDVVTSMLDIDPKKRPSAQDIINVLNFLTNQEESHLKIENLEINFNGNYGKLIKLTKNAIVYNNTVHPSIAHQTKNFPASYFQQKQTSITNEQYESILKQIINAGLFDFASVSTGSVTGPVNNKLTCLCSNGKIYSYSAVGEPDARFNAISNILSPYCEFPEIQSEWYVTTGGYGYSTSSAATAAPSTHGATDSHTNSDWFETAGDL